MRKQIRNLDAERLLAYWKEVGEVWVREVRLDVRRVRVQLANGRQRTVSLDEIDFSRRTA